MWTNFCRWVLTAVYSLFNIIGFFKFNKRKGSRVPVFLAQWGSKSFTPWISFSLVYCRTSLTFPSSSLLIVLHSSFLLFPFRYNKSDACHLVAQPHLHQRKLRTLKRTNSTVLFFLKITALYLISFLFFLFCSHMVCLFLLFLCFSDHTVKV